YHTCRGLDARANSREPPQARILTQIVELTRIELLFTLLGLPQSAIQKRQRSCAALPRAAANYPLVSIPNNRTGPVFYSRTHDHTSRLLHLALSGLLISMCPQPKSGPHETR